MIQTVRRLNVEIDGSEIAKDMTRIIQENIKKPTATITTLTEKPVVDIKPKSKQNPPIKGEEQHESHKKQRQQKKIIKKKKQIKEYIKKKLQNNGIKGIIKTKEEKKK